MNLAAFRQPASRYPFIVMLAAALIAEAGASIALRSAVGSQSQGGIVGSVASILLMPGLMGTMLQPGWNENIEPNWLFVVLFSAVTWAAGGTALLAFLRRLRAT